MLWVVYFNIFKAVSIPVCQLMCLVILLVLYAKKHITTYAPKEWFITRYAQFHYWTMFGAYTASSFFFIMVQFLKTIYNVMKYEPSVYTSVVTFLIEVGTTFTFIGIACQYFLFFGLPCFYRYRTIFLSTSVAILCVMIYSIPYSGHTVDRRDVNLWVVAPPIYVIIVVAMRCAYTGFTDIDSYNLDDDEYPSALYMYKPRIGAMAFCYSYLILLQADLAARFPHYFDVAYGFPFPLVAFYILRIILAKTFRRRVVYLTTRGEPCRIRNVTVARYRYGRRNYERLGGVV